MKIIALLIPSMIVLLVCSITSRREGNATATANSPAASSMSFALFDSRFGKYSKTTNAQKDEEIGQVKGSRVEWTGVVDNADGKILYVRENATTISADVRIELRDGERHKLSSVEKGMIVIYRGTVDSYGVIMAHKLVDGEIVSYRRADAVETVEMLTDTEHDVVTNASR